jgi:ubiquinone/menaquinone biosynthesis C-methylase UbiE
MQPHRHIELLVSLHTGLSRLGPGSDAATLQALALCAELPAKPLILDIGCGSGAQSLVLAAAGPSRLVAMDMIPGFVVQLMQQAALKAITDRISGVVADMHALPFAQQCFDLIWSEGAIYNMGFDYGLERWRPLLRPGGYLVVSEMSWFESNPTQELRDYWRENYPGMRSVTANRQAAVDLGWLPIGDFALPATAWHENYYAPLQRRFPAFLQAHPGDPDAAAVVRMTEQEIAVMRHNVQACGYQFYVLRRPHTWESPY